jgi:hypothetical protein
VVIRKLFFVLYSNFHRKKQKKHQQQLALQQHKECSNNMTGTYSQGCSKPIGTPATVREPVTGLPEKAQMSATARIMTRCCKSRGTSNSNIRNAETTWTGTNSKG